MESKPLVPKLRFPEFLGAPRWERSPLVKLADFVNEKVPVASVTVQNYVSTENLLADYGGVSIASKLPTAGSVTRYRSGDVLISNIRPYLKKVWYADRGGGASNDVIVLRSKGALSETYLFLLLANDAFISYLARGAKGVKMPRGDVDSMRAYPIAFPEPAEQQKIADCLTSLDELIAAEGRRLEALCTYKKGLMQNLFPREGETIPRIRFPKFRNAPAWHPVRLKDASPAIFDGTHQTPTYVKDGIPFFSVENLISGVGNKFITYEDYLLATKFNRPEKGDVLLTRIGKIGFSQVVTWDYPFSVYVTLAVIKKAPNFNSEYLSQFMQSSFYQLELSKSSLHIAVPPKINMDTLRATMILLPESGEQKRIADCLGSLDSLITAQAKKIDCLKHHKQGLMQGLFPSLDEVTA